MRQYRPVRRLAAITCTVLAAAALAGPGETVANADGPAPYTGLAALPLDHAGTWLTDAAGRVVILHGLNQVFKLAPYEPAADGFGDDDAAFLAENGFDAVRVGVIWAGVEPQPGVYDDAYLDSIADTVQTLAAHGIVSILD